MNKGNQQSNPPIVLFAPWHSLLGSRYAIEDLMVLKRGFRFVSTNRNLAVLEMKNSAEKKEVKSLPSFSFIAKLPLMFLWAWFFLSFPQNCILSVKLQGSKNFWNGRYSKKKPFDLNVESSFFVWMIKFLSSFRKSIHY